ncbi:unnamed protein product [Paramecium sonneborni]|uniref:Uncharacterized protein n=1 Tax=Paramecium sonneborni TaxID=65129 RepID=A0A8S1N5G5_9CILI|nr:unnamed protein product [Paramecium sonneborni]
MNAKLISPIQQFYFTYNRSQEPIEVKQQLNIYENPKNLIIIGLNRKENIKPKKYMFQYHNIQPLKTKLVIKQKTQWYQSFQNMFFNNTNSSKNLSKQSINKILHCFLIFIYLLSLQSINK